MRKIILVFCLLLSWVIRAAEHEQLLVTEETPLRPVTTSFMIGGGSLQLTDNYLSPFKTTGWQTQLNFERVQAWRGNPKKLSLWLATSLSFGRTHNQPTANGTMWRAMLNAECGMLCRISPVFEGLVIALGPQIELAAGADYRPANGNNPVGAQAAVSLAPTVHLNYPVRIASVPVTLGYHASLPLAGMFFAPEYGELYYEIYLGARQGLCHFSWPGNRLEYHHLLYADIQFGTTSLRLGYDMRGLTQSANHLATNVLSNQFVIGITTTKLSINPSAAKKSPNIILGL